MLLPNDAITKAKIRTQLSAFDATLPAFFAIHHTFGKDDSKIEAFRGTLHMWNHLARAVSQGKWFAGTDEPTMIDIHIAPFFELLFAWQKPPMSNVTDKLDLAQNGPNVLQFVEKFRIHESF
jgi:glutathione S-transferase